MGRKAIVLLPAIRRSLAAVGENLRLARLRRGLAAALLAERAGITRQTLRAIERGDAAVSAGNYAMVLFVLGLEADLARVARDDELGRRLQDAHLAPKPRQRAPRAYARRAPR